MRIRSTAAEHPAPPPAPLVAAWVCRLRWHFDLFNDHYLAGKLRPPLIEVRPLAERLGEWNSRLRLLAIGESHVLAQRWESVLDTLRHEMAHQYVDEVLALSGAPPHGDPFRYACRLLRCDVARVASAASLGELRGSNDVRDRMMLRIRELLALAGSPNEHEAANAMRMAHRFLLEYNLDLAQVERATDYVHRQLGVCSPRIQEYQYGLSRILQDHFFVLTIWNFSYDAAADRPGRILQISGSVENVEMAAYVHDYVTELAARWWRERRRQRRGGAGRGTKLQYLAGLIRGFQEKLDAERRHLAEERGLVWLGDPELGAYFRHLHPRTRSISTGGVSQSARYRDGVEDGRRIQLRRGIAGDGDAVSSRGRLLPGPGA